MIGKIIANKYRILDLKGSGGMAMVYRAQNIDTGDIVAIKVLKPEHMQDEEILRRFEVEIQIASTYSHRNIVKTYETGHEDDMHYIVMEFVDGYTLQEYIHWKSRLDIEETLDIGRKICDALFYAHSHRLIHRDVKPQNILLSRDGGVKVADFGIAKAPSMETATMGGESALGSVHYISPEQARGLTMNEQADIYSIGVVLYEMATGQVPFSGDTPVSVALKQVQEDPRPPRQLRADIPVALEKIILKAMMKNPAARYDNAREMARDLEKVTTFPEGNYVVVKNVYDDESIRALPKTPLPYEGQESLSATPRPFSRDSAIRAGRADGPRRRIRTRGILTGAFIVGAVLLIAVALLVFLNLYSQPGKNYATVVPDVSGLPEVVATSQLTVANLLYEIERVHDDTVEADKVISQSPTGGTHVLAGSTVKLTISMGASTVEVPDLLGMAAYKAREAAQAAGLRIESIEYVESDRPADQIVRQDPMPGTRAAKDSGIRVYISKATAQAAPVMVDLIGLTQETAQARVRELGYEVVRINKKSSAYAKGEVAQQFPDPGTPLDANTEITIWISTGDIAGYTKPYQLDILVEDKETHVQIYFDDEAADEPVVVYDAICPPGTHPVTLDLQSPTTGKKQLIIYYDEVEVGRKDVEIKSGDR